MIYNLKSIRKQVLGLALREAGFKARGFREGTGAQARLELVAGTVVNGYALLSLTLSMSRKDPGMRNVVLWCKPQRCG